MDGKSAGLTRRRLIQVGGSAAAVMYIGRLPTLAFADTTAPGYLRRSAYAGLAGSQFEAVGAGATLTLTGVADLARAQTEPAFVGRDDAFGLSFVGPHDVVLAGGMHELAHTTLGTFTVFIAPVERSTGSQSYEVVVDRSVTLAGARREAPSPLAQSQSQSSGAPAAAVPTAGAGAASAGAGQPRPTPQAPKARAHVPPVELATMARRGGVLTADVRVAGQAGIVSVRATLFHGRVEYARAGRLLRGRRALRLNLRELRPVTPGDYVLHVTTSDHRGRHVLTEKRVTVR